MICLTEIKSSSSFMVFSIVKNIEMMIKKEKIIDPFKTVNLNWYKHAKEYSINNCKKIYNDIENNYYSYYDLAIFLLYDYLFTDNFDIRRVNPDDVNKILNIFTQEKLKQDMELMKSINDELKLKNLSEYFIITEQGYPVIYTLVKKGYISLYFYLKYEQKLLTKRKENDILDCKEFETFKKVSSLIKQIIIQKN